MRKFLFYIALIILLPALVWIVHQNERPSSIFYLPYDLAAINTPSDSTGSLSLNWFPIAGDNQEAPTFAFYNIWRSQNENGPFDVIDSLSILHVNAAEKTRQYRDTSVVIGQTYYYKVSAQPNGEAVESNIVGPITAVAIVPPSGLTGELAEILFPPTQLRAFDAPNDDGHVIMLEWKVSPNDVPKSRKFNGYRIFRATSQDGPFEQVGDITGGESDVGRHIKTFTDGNNISRDSSYYYFIQAKFDGQTADTGVIGPAKAKAQWFHTGRGVSLLLLGILMGGILFYINQAKSGKELFIRKIAGLEAVDEAVGRATEMGKKIFYIPGTQDMDNVQTIAGLTILSRVARLTAEYETKLEVPVSRSLVMITGREVVKEAYLNTGRPDSYNDDMVYYLTDDQFGYAAGIDGLVVRQKPATIFYMGAFYAESLVLAETGNSIGAIQIAGTAMPAQLPFFVAACDYTLIGEELFAASAYLSREPRLLGSLKGQDIGGKLVFLTLAVIFIVIVTVAAFGNPELVATVTRIFNVN